MGGESNTEEELVEAFKSFHPGEDGKVSKNQIIDYLNQLGESISLTEVDEMLE